MRLKKRKLLQNGIPIPPVLLLGKYADDRYQKRIVVLKSNRAKYKGELNDVVEIFTSQPDILLENYPDVFVGNGGRRAFPTLKGKPRTYDVQFTCIKGARVLWIGTTGFGKKE